MKGITYITDKKQRVHSVVLDYKLFKNAGEELEDIFDVLVSEARKNEKNVPFETVIENLKRKGKL
jgi:hypothetical protein